MGLIGNGMVVAAVVTAVVVVVLCALVVERINLGVGDGAVVVSGGGSLFLIT